MKKITLILIIVFTFQVGLLQAQSQKILDDTRQEISQRAVNKPLGPPSAYPYTEGTKSIGKQTLALKQTGPQNTGDGPHFFGYVAYSNQSAINIGPMSFSANNPGSVTSLANQTGQDFIAGASWANNNWYGAVNTNSGYFLVTIDTATGARTTIASMALYVDAMAYDWTTNTMYVSAWNGTNYELHTLDLLNGAMTLIGPLSVDYFATLACDIQGNLYSIGINYNILYAIDKTTATPTAIGYTGITAMYSQDMEYDNASNTMYYAAFNNDLFQGELRTVNLSTGNTSLVGVFAGGMEVTGLAIPNANYTHDLALAAIVSPASGPGLGSAEVVTVTVTNQTANDENNVYVSYKLDNATVVTELIPYPVTALSSTDFSFTQTVDLSTTSQLYHLQAYVAVSGDQNPLNDTLNAAIFSEGMYCTSVSNNCLDYIAGVEINTINQVSACTNYADYSSQTTDVEYGVSSLLTITVGNPQAGSEAAVFIDWNQNGDFTDDASVPVTGGPATFLVPVLAPNDALPGASRMRIIVSSNGAITPCSVYFSGETEDYTLTITGTPVTDDLKAVSILSPSSVNGLPAIYYPSFEVLNTGTADQTDISVGYSLNNGPAVTETWNTTLTGLGGTNIYTFSQGITLNTCGSYSLKVFTSVPGDTNMNNDTVHITLTANSYLQVNASATVQQAIQALLSGSGLTISNITYTGDNNSLGIFAAPCSNLGLDSGLVLSTGYVSYASGPNNTSSAGLNLNLPGNALLNNLIGGITYDAATLEFDIIPQYDTIAFRYVFGSEEYPEFVNQYNDVFAFFVSGPDPSGGSYQNKNIAIIPGTTNQVVSINNINNGTSNTGPCDHCEYYVHNTENSLQLDAFTTPLTAQFVAVPGATYHLIITIADAVDHVWDSDVFLEAASFSSPAGDVILSGSVEYDNDPETPIVNATVQLKQSGAVVAQTTTNAYGNYQFSNVPAGTYDLVISHSAPWGGVNSVDGLLIQSHFVGMSPLSGLYLLAADLNGNSSINSIDALFAVSRFVGLISAFTAVPDWIFEEQTVTLIPGSPVIMDVKGVCAGDVNGSYVP